MSDDKKIVYFVREGQMHSSWIIGHVDIDVQVEDSESYTKPNEILQNVLVKDGETDANAALAPGAIQKHVRLHDLTTRPGRWLFLSGHNVVHADDCYATKEQAANEYVKKLLEDVK